MPAKAKSKRAKIVPVNDANANAEVAEINRRDNALAMAQRNIEQLSGRPAKLVWAGPDTAEAFVGQIHAALVSWLSEDARCDGHALANQIRTLHDRARVLRIDDLPAYPTSATMTVPEARGFMLALESALKTSGKPSAAPVLDEIDMKILEALEKYGHAVKLVDLVAKVRHDRDTCAVHVKLLIEQGYAARKSIRSGVAITQAGKTRLPPPDAKPT